MSSEFFVDVHEEENEPRVRIGLRQGNDICYLTPFCATEEELASAVERLQVDLSRVQDEGSQALRSRQQEKADADRSSDPASAWAVMRNMESREDMFNYFNSLDEQLRRETAEYILTQVSMFKGLGPVFASHYNAQSAYLE